ncbi:MAG TPA: branched-chain amino acid ABC transporter permease [Thermodesulfobacteriota bacterium]
MLEYVIAIVTFTAIYAVVALGLNLQWGETGLVNLGQVGFMAVGAYTSALLALAGWSFWIAIPAAAAAAGVSSLLLVAVTPRLRDDYLAIVTLGFSEAIRLVLLNEAWIGGGARGLVDLPQPLRGVVPDGAYTAAYAALAVAAVAVTGWVFGRITRAPIGRLLRAVREDEIVPQAVGKSVFRLKAQAFVLGAAAAGLGGSLYVHYLRYIAPEMFTAQVSVFVLVAVLAAGGGSHARTVLGAVVVALILEGTRFLKDYLPGIDGVQLAALRLMVIGAALVALCLWRPWAMARREAP